MVDVEVYQSESASSIRRKSPSIPAPQLSENLILIGRQLRSDIIQILEQSDFTSDLGGLVIIKVAMSTCGRYMKVYWRPPQISPTEGAIKERLEMCTPEIQQKLESLRPGVTVPRLSFHFDGTSYSKLTSVIEQLNQLAVPDGSLDSGVGDIRKEKPLPLTPVSNVYGLDREALLAKINKSHHITQFGVSEIRTDLESNSNHSEAMHADHSQDDPKT